MMISNTLTFIRGHWLASLITAGVLSFGAYALFFQTDTESTGVVTKRTATVEKADLQVIVAGSGQVVADSQVDLKPVVAGDAIEVVTVAVKNDQEVKKGQVIAVLDNQDARRDVAKAELDLRQAEIKEKQTDDLYPKLDRDDMRQRQLANVSVAQSQIALEKSRDRLQDYTVRAPFDGIVTGLSVDSGDTISQTGILASVITKQLRVSVALNEVDAAKVREGNRAELTFVALPNVTVTGRVIKLDTIGTVTQNVVSYGAEIELDRQPEGLKPGMSATADIVVAEKTGVLTVPNAAIATSNGKTTVTVLGNSARARTDETDVAQSSGEEHAVVIGLSNDTATEIVSGLSEGMVVQLAGAAVSGMAAPAASSGQGSILNLFRGTSSNRSSGFSR